MWSTTFARVVLGAWHRPFGGVADPPQPEMFFAPTQWTSSVSDLSFVVRGGSTQALAASLRTILREEDPRS